jgi:cytochrome P450
MAEDQIAARGAPARGLDRPYKFDLVGAAAKRDPFAQHAAMRAAGPVIPMKLPVLGAAWLTTTHAAAEAMVKDNQTFVQEGEHAGKSGPPGMQWWMPKGLRLLAGNMLMKDEPEHRRLRKLVDKAFARRDVLAMRDSIDLLADRILDRFEGRSEVDLAAEFSRRLPLEVICELLGLPEADRDGFSGWSRAFALKNAFDLMRMMGAVDRMSAYLRGQIEACRRAPRTGLISELVRDEEDGDRLTEDELVAMVFLLLVAGFETTTHLISDSVVALEQNPEQKAYLLADPASRMERAVEELARYNSPVQTTKPRYVACDTELFGVALRRGELIMASLASANSDPETFAEPKQLQLDRFPNPHLVFSSGIHFCLGMQLARVETQSALGRLYARFPQLQIAPPEQIRWASRLGIRGVAALPTRLRPTVAKKLAA